MPHLGRWASADPLEIHQPGEGGEVGNAFHYVSGNLLQARDPIGLDASYDRIDGQWYRVEDADENSLTYTAIDNPRQDAVLQGGRDAVDDVADGVIDSVVDRATDPRRPG